MLEAMGMTAGLAILAWYLSALYVGARLLSLGLRRDNPPARWIGTYLFAAMGLGSILMSIPMWKGTLTGAGMTSLDRMLLGLGFATVVLGNVGILTFTRRVFRPQSKAALAYAFAVTALLVSGAVGHGVTTQFDRLLHTFFATLYLTGTILTNGWAALESLLYYAAMRKRVKVGLAQPLEANRFLLWGAGAGAAALMLLSTTLEMQLPRIMSASEILSVRMITLPFMAILGLTCAGCYLFAFFPAAWYAQRFAAPTANATR
jgi:hypothetical protein